MSTPLLRARERQKLRQEDLAAAVGVAQSVISRAERGLVRPTADLAEKLAQKLGISELEIIYPERYPEPVEPKRKRAA